MTFRDVANILESWAPPPVAESYDNVGLLVGLPDTELTGILVNLDMTEAVVLEAKSKGCNLVVAHHPIWFTPRKRLNGEDYVSRTIISAIKNDIGLYALHTNLDNVQSGVNHMIARRLGLEGLEFLLPKGPDAAYGSGMIGFLPQALAKQDFLAKVKESFHCGGIRYADCPRSHIQKVAVCGGSGSFLTSEAIRQGADALLTADITYHKFFDNEDQLLLMDIGHYESEQFTSQLICQYLSEHFRTFAVHFSQIVTNPIKYF